MLPLFLQQIQTEALLPLLSSNFASRSVLLLSNQSLEQLGSGTGIDTVHLLCAEDNGSQGSVQQMLLAGHKKRLLTRWKSSSTQSSKRSMQAKQIRQSVRRSSICTDPISPPMRISTHISRSTSQPSAPLIRRVPPSRSKQTRNSPPCHPFPDSTLSLQALKWCAAGAHSLVFSHSALIAGAGCRVCEFC
jgi:hypothetical protein